MEKKKRREASSKPGALRIMKPDDNIRPQTSVPPRPAFKAKTAKFRCANPSCEGYTRIRDDVLESQAKDFNYCMDCGNENMERVKIYECAKCAEEVIVPYNKPTPQACACGHTKLNLK